MNFCRERKRKVLKILTGLFEAVWVCDLVSCFSFPRSAEPEFNGINLAWNGVAGSALISLWSLTDVFFWCYRFRKTTTASPCRYLAKSFPLPTRMGVCILFQWLPGTRSLNFFPRSSWIRCTRGRIGFNCFPFVSFFLSLLFLDYLAALPGFSRDVLWVFLLFPMSFFSWCFCFQFVWSKFPSNVHINILRGLPCRLESLRLKFTNEPSIFVEGDLDESIKPGASDRLGDLVPQVRARTSPGVFRDMALLGLCLELSFKVAFGCLFLLLLLYSFHPIAEITLKNANIKDEFKGASTRINY